MTCARVSCFGDDCSEPQVCERWDVVWRMPVHDPNVYDVCLTTMNTCMPDDNNPGYCNVMARWLKPEVAAKLQCELEHGCSDHEACRVVEPAVEHVVAKYCERAAACNDPCPVAPYIKMEAWFRPELERGLRQCLSEDSCSKFEACSFAFAQAVVVLGSAKSALVPDSCQAD